MRPDENTLFRNFIFTPALLCHDTMRVSAIKSSELYFKHTKKRCGFNFNCASMMLQPGLEPKDCPNFHTCGSVSELTPEEEVELTLVREVENQQRRQEWERVYERIRVSRQQAAVMMLRSRGCPQSLESLGITELLAQLEGQLEQVRSQVREIEHGGYVAPEGVEVHAYNVKRPRVVRTEAGRVRQYAVYWYNKLTSNEAIFAPEERQGGVKVIHLSHDDDPRNLEARDGVERRNQLLKVKTQLQGARGALELAIRVVEGEV